MTPRQALQALPKGWGKIGGAALAIAGVVMVFGRDWVELPAQVEANQKAIGSHALAIRELARGDSLIIERLDGILCILGLPDSLTHVQAEVRCR